MTRGRTAVKIDVTKLQIAINNCEDREKFANHGKLFAAVAVEYQNLTSSVIPATALALKAKEWKLSVRTISGKAKMAALDFKKLQAVITEVEKVGIEGKPYPTYALLFAEVAKQYGEKHGLVASGAMLSTAAQKNGLVITTEKGKRGNDGSGLAAWREAGGKAGRGVRSSRADKFATNPKIAKAMSHLIQLTPERYQPVAERVKAGSMKAAVKLKCLDCSGYQTQEIKLCTVTACPLYSFRPYQKGKEGDEAPPEKEIVIKEAS